MSVKRFKQKKFKLKKKTVVPARNGKLVGKYVRKGVGMVRYCTCDLSETFWICV